MEAAAASGDFETAFPDLFLAAYRVTHRVLGEGARAEDAAAEAMVRALLSWPRIGDLAHREAWVMRVASNLAIDEIRRQTRRRRPPLPAAREVADGAEGVSLRMAVVAALATLSARQREVVALRYLADLDEAEVSRVLGISVNSVKKHAMRGRAALRAQLGPSPEVRLALE